MIFRTSEPIVGTLDRSIVTYDKTTTTLSEFVKINDTTYETNLESTANTTTLQIKSFRWSLPPWEGIPVADSMQDPCAGYLYNASSMTLLGRVGFLDGHESRVAACQTLCEANGDTFCYLQDESGLNCNHCLNFPCYGLGTSWCSSVEGVEGVRARCAKILIVSLLVHLWLPRITNVVNITL